MEKPSLEIGNSNWAIKEGELLGYDRVGNDYLPIPITMTRASLGTRVNPQGLVEDVALLGSEQITNGNFSDGQNNWSFGTGWSIIDGKATVVNQTSWLTTTGASILANKQIKLQFDVVLDGGTLRVKNNTNDFDETFNTVGSYTITRYYSTGGSASNLQFPNYGSGFSGSIDNVSVKEATIDNLPRVDYTDGASSLLAEPQRTNLLPYSEDFSQPHWQKQTGIVPTYNTTETLSPDGTYNATKFIGTGSTGVFDSSISVSGNITRSVYLKSVSGTTTAVFKDPNATGGATPVNLTITNEWQRFELTGDNGTAFQGLWIDDITSDGLYMWGAQLEEGSYGTSYIPTSGGTVTRVQDQYSKTGISDKINSEEGVLFVEGSILSDDGTTQIISLFESASSRVSLTFSSTLNRIQFYVAINGYTNTVTINAEGFTKTQVNKIALRYGANNYALFINGVKEGENTTQGNTFTVGSLTELTLSNTLPFYGKVKQLQVFKTALTDDELTILTGTSGVHFYTSYAAMASGLTYKIE